MVTTTTGIATSFIDFTRASNATVTDSDGKVKWAPHNLLTNSESFASSPWATYNATIASNFDVAPNGTTTADRFTIGGVAPSVYVLNGILAGQHTLAFFAKAGTSSTASISVSALGNGQLATFNMSTLATSITAVGTGGTVSGGTASITAVGSSGWFYCVFASVTTTGTNNVGFSIEGTSGQTGLIWGAALYRSDLGGMQPNTSAYPMYNPTTPKNLLGYTEDFSNAAWTKANIAAFGSGSVSNAILAPNGLQTADKVVASNSASATRAVYQNFTPVSGSAYVVSVYAKAAEYSNLAIQEIGAGRFGASFNLVAQTATSLGGGGYVTSSITSISDGWFRCSVTWTASGGAAVTMIGYPAGATVSAGGTSYAGDGTSGIYLWGAQLSDSASLDSYSPVYGAAVTSAAYYGPRRDFDSAGVCKGLLVEEQRTNLLTNSAAFNSWSTSNSTVDTNISTITAPDGTTSAERVVATNSSGYVYQQVAITNATAYTYSAYLKTDNLRYVSLVFAGSGWTGGNFANFDLQTGAVVSAESGITAHTPVALGNGWYRVSATKTASSSATSDFRIQVSPSAWVSGTADKWFVWGAQLEAGSFATSYIPTGAATATRNVDVASVSTQAFPYSSTEGTVVANFMPLLVSTANVIFNLGAGADSNSLYSTAGASQNLVVRSAGSTTVLLNAGGFSVGAASKLGAAFKSSDYAVVTNGGTVATVASGALPTGSATTLALGGGAPLSGGANGHIRQITYLPRRISNTELQTRTA